MLKIGNYIKQIFTGAPKITEETSSELEEILIMADLGPELTEELINWLKNEKKPKIDNSDQLLDIINTHLLNLFQFESQQNYNFLNSKIKVIMGVNGTGKTTSIAKMANLLKKSNNKSLLVAGDTYRAAAIEQLEKWSHITGLRIIKGNQGGDPGAVVYDALDSFYSRDENYVLIDTSGRMHTRQDLLEELKKIIRIIEKKSEQEIEKILVLDSTTGQNAYNQVSTFIDNAGVDSIVLTKIDGDSKGGTILRIVNDYKIPISFICSGEQLNDIQQFDPNKFLDMLFK